MKAKSLILGCLLLLPGLLYAQTTPPPKPPDVLENAWNVSVNGGYSNVSNAPTNNGFVTGISFRLSQHLNLRSDVYILNSPQGMVLALAGPEYRFSLEHLLKSSAFAANASRVEAFFNVGAGDARTSTVKVAADGTSTTSVSKAKFAASVGGGFDIKISDTVTMRPLDVKYVKSSFLNAGGGLYGNQLSFAAGLNLRF
jgi:hypothetical protein